MGCRRQPGTSGQGAGKAREMRGVVAETDYVMTGQLVTTHIRYVSELDRHIDAAVAWHAELEPAAIRIAVEVLVHLIDADREISVRRWANANPGRPNRVRKRAVADVAARQGFRLAAQ